MGNYLNGTNFAGGAYGFKISSINKVCGSGGFLTDNRSWWTPSRPKA